MTILWLDDVRDPYKYLSKKSDSGAFQRNKAFYDKLLSNGNVDFVWVKNFEEFTGYILKNGVPEFVSFDHDLGNGLKKGLDCAKWLQEYCRESGQPFPKFFVHSANPNGQREINGLLNSVNEGVKKKRKVRLNEGILRAIIRESLQEISPELLARAYVGANVDDADIASSNGNTVLNRNGNVVHRKTQADRRDRQMRGFRERLGSDLSKKLGRDVKISKGGLGDNSSYYGEVSMGGSPIFHHYAHVNGDDPTSVYHDDRYGVKIGKSDMDASDYVSGLVDAMAGYHDELTGGREFNDRLGSINDRVNDVENLQKYYRDKKEYDERDEENRREIENYERLPWYKKIGRKAPKRSTAEKPKAPVTKTGPYFMPGNPEGLMKQAERLKATRENNKSAYNKRLKKGNRLTEDILRDIIRESLSEIVLGPGERMTPYSKEEAEINRLPFTRKGVEILQCVEQNPNYAEFKRWRENGLRSGIPSRELSYERWKNSVLNKGG